MFQGTSNKSSRSDDKDVSGEAMKGKVYNNSTSSELWNYLEKIDVVDGAEKCKCKVCGMLYSYEITSVLLIYGVMFLHAIQFLSTIMLGLILLKK